MKAGLRKLEIAGPNLIKKFTAVIYNKLECFPCQALSNGFLRPGTCPRVERMKGASHGKAIWLERHARDKH